MFCWSFLLDVVLCGLAIVAYVVFNKKSIKHKHKRNDDLEESITPDEQPSSSLFNHQQQKLNLDTHALLEQIGNIQLSACFFFNMFNLKTDDSFAAIFCVLSTLLVAAVLQPSIPNAIYFLAFLLIITAWAIDVLRQKAFVRIVWALCTIMVIHMCMLFAFHTVWLEGFVEKRGRILRYVQIQNLGFTVG